MHLVPAIYNDSKSNPSLLRTLIISRKSPRKRKIGVDESVLFRAADKIVDIDSISEQESPENVTFKRLDNGVKLFNLKCTEDTDILAVLEYISVNSYIRILQVYLEFCRLEYIRILQVPLSYHSVVIPLPQWFRYEHNCTLLNLVCMKTKE